MLTSQSIASLATALAIAQGRITGALKDSTNPFFTSKYADLASCWDACRAALSENGLSIVQGTRRGENIKIEWDTTDQKSGETTHYTVETQETVIVTMLLHSSGEWMLSELPLIPRDASPQGVGSAITYGRRYALCALVGVAQVDDDGNGASGRGHVDVQRASQALHRPATPAKVLDEYDQSIPYDDPIPQHSGVQTRLDPEKVVEGLKAQASAAPSAQIRRATEAQIGLLKKKLTRAGLHEADVFQAFKIGGWDEVKMAMVDKIIAYLEGAAQ